jgi:two-component system, OmpR family, KDP operon response regulator KdpE
MEQPKMKVLLIDDNPIARQHMTAVLQAKGYEVIFAGNGEDGIKQLENAPDFVVLDLFMPKMNGWEFLDIKAVSLYAKIPVIVASNWAVLPEPLPETAGVTDILTKDMDHTSQVLAALKRRLDEKSDFATVPTNDH